MSPADARRVLAPLYKLADIRNWSPRAVAELAELISPKTVADITVAELIELQQDVLREIDA